MEAVGVAICHPAQAHREAGCRRREREIESERENEEAEVP